MQFHKTTLPNGLRIISIPMPSVESATVMVVVGAGSRFENKNNNGISHFLEHMAFKGTKNRPSALAISTLIDGVGGECNAFTGKEETGFYIKSAATHVELSFDVLSDMLQHSLFDPKEINKERGVILEEINLYEDTPSRKIGDVYESLLYGNTPMGWDIAGKKEIIKKIHKKDFVDYMKSLYSANNIAVVVAGGIKHNKIVQLAEKYFGKMRHSDTLKYIKTIEKQKEPKLVVKPKKTEQVHIALGVRTVPINHPHKYPLMLLASILGGGMSSRLFHEVREKRGLAYYVRTMSEHYQDCGNLTSYAGVDSKRVQEAVSVILSQYKKIRNGLLNSNSKVKINELKKAKEFVKGHLILELEDSRSVAAFYASQELLENKIDTPDQVLQKIEKVTLEDIEEVAKKYFVNTNLNLAVIGNFNHGQRLEKILEL
ncbi:MAG: insulinase family protein [Patescibacteria group bacterium]|nr:insulinase family protein [Patescibacteria group bacterium]